MTSPAPKLRLNDGDVVARRYRIDGIVGKGGFGAVYRAVQLDTGALVALKVLLANYGSSDVDSRRFKREAALVQSLRHPNIVQLLDFGQTDKGIPFIAFELLSGSALGAVIKRDGAVPIHRAIAIAKEVLCALAAAHAVGVIHRDIKPQNVFLCAGGESKVLDFGIAKAVAGEQKATTQLTESGQMIGTPHYMSPEQVRGTELYPASDLYALGLVLAEMLTGERVVRAEALIDVYMAHISDQPLPLPRDVLDCPVGPVIAKATSKAVAARYGSAAEMLTALEAVALTPASRRAAPTESRDAPTRPIGAHAAPPQSQGMFGTVMIDIEPERLGSTVEMAPTGQPSPTGTVELGDSAPESQATVVMPSARAEGPEPPRGARAMSQLGAAPAQRNAPFEQRPAISWQALPASAQGRTPPAAVPGLPQTGAPWPLAPGGPSPHPASAWPIPGALPPGAFPQPAPPKKAASAIWVALLVLLLTGSALGLWAWLR